MSKILETQQTLPNGTKVKLLRDIPYLKKGEEGYILWEWGTAYIVRDDNAVITLGNEASDDVIALLGEDATHQRKRGIDWEMVE